MLWVSAAHTHLKTQVHCSEFEKRLWHRAGCASAHDPLCQQQSVVACRSLWRRWAPSSARSRAPRPTACPASSTSPRRSPASATTAPPTAVACCRRLRRAPTPSRAPRGLRLHGWVTVHPTPARCCVCGQITHPVVGVTVLGADSTALACAPCWCFFSGHFESGQERQLRLWRWLQRPHSIHMHEESHMGCQRPCSDAS